MASLRESSVFSMVTGLIAEALLLFFICSAVKWAEHSWKWSLIATFTFELVIDIWESKTLPLVLSMQYVIMLQRKVNKQVTKIELGIKSPLIYLQVEYKLDLQTNFL